MNYFTIAKDNMVKNQLMPNHVKDEQILDAFFAVPRHEFVDVGWQKVCYSDCRIPMAENRFLLSPDVQARMIQALDLKPNSKVLDIGCGSGYSSVILAKLCASVVGVEANSLLASFASKYVAKHEIGNIAIKLGEYFTGASEEAPFDAILINGAVKSVPKMLLNQLATGGKLVCIIKNGAVSKAVRYDCLNGRYSHVELFDAYGDLL